MKKGDLSITTIIVVVLGLLVLVILAYILFNTSSGFGDQTECGQQGGICVDNCDSDDHPPGIESGEAGNACPADDEECCSPSGWL